MNRQRLRQWAAAIIVLAGLVVAGLSAKMGNMGTSVLGGLGVLVGVTVYVGIGRYREHLDQFQGSTVDFTTTPAFSYSLVHVVALGTFFAVLLYLAVNTGRVTSSIANAVTSAPMGVVLIGVVPGIVLGAGYPVVIQRQDLVSRLNVARISFGVDNALTIGAYVLLLVGYDPAAAVFYASAYVVSRLASLTTIYAGGRPHAAGP